jgi:dTDP-4-dehydrorhamnose 3,5-epimerase
MDVLPTSLEGVLLIKPHVFEDKRGFFMETYHLEKYGRQGVHCTFVQDNLSFSSRNTLRGLHYQHPHSQAKLIQVVKGEVFDVAVDIRRNSANFGKWVGVNLSEENKWQVFVPEGFAHGFYVISEIALVHYKCSDFYAPKCEGGILWCDDAIGIEWPVSNPLLSDKDSRYPCLRKVTENRLPKC